jgi:hypothetical protein
VKPRLDFECPFPKTVTSMVGSERVSDLAIMCEELLPAF